MKLLEIAHSRTGDKGDISNISVIAYDILSYADAFDVAEYAVPAMQWACGAGILNGTGDGSTLSPLGTATRAQLAVMLYRWLS